MTNESVLIYNKKEPILHKNEILALETDEGYQLAIKVGDFLSIQDKIDCDPVGQRPPTEKKLFGKKKPSKVQSIIGALFAKKDLCEINLAQTKSGEKYPFESIDGGNRKRAIIGFSRNQFCTHESSVIGKKYMRDLTSEERDYFLNKWMRIYIHKNLGIKEKSDAFQHCNNVTGVNHQENLNSRGNIPIANLVRDTVRHAVDDQPCKMHKFFEYSTTTGATQNEDDEDNVVYEYLTYKNDRLIHDERFARIVYLCYAGEKLGPCDDEQLKSMYDDPSLTQEKVDELKEKSFKVLDFMTEIARARKRLKAGKGITKDEYTMLYRLYFYYKELCKGKDFKLLNATKFYIGFREAFDKFKGEDKTKILKEVVDDIDTGNERLIHEAFGGYIGDHKSEKKTRLSVEWLINKGGFDAVKIEAIQLRDSNRFFKRSMVEQKLAEQGYKCWVTEEPLYMDDAQGGHIKPYSQGGESTYENLVVISAEHNRKMGEMNAHEYKEMVLNKPKLKKVAKRK